MTGPWSERPAATVTIRVRRLARYLPHGRWSKLSAGGVVAAVALPAAVFGACLVAFHTHLRGIDRLRVVLLADVLVVVSAAVALAHFGVPYVVCLVVIALAPVLPIVLDEVTAESRREEAIA